MKLRLEDFERSIVFRSARFLPLFLCAMATLLLAGAGVALAYSLMPSWDPREPGSVKEPPLAAVTRAEVDEYLRLKAQLSAPPVRQADTAARSAPRASDAAVAIANELHVLRTLTAERQLPWEDQYVDIGWWQRRKVASGVGDSIRPLLTRFDEGNVRETVQTGGSRYRINPSRHETKVAIIREAQTILSGTTTTEARQTFQGWLELRTAREDARAQEYKREQERVLRAYQEAKAAHEAALVRKRGARGFAVVAAGLALAGFMLFGLVLAVLAIERHTRLLEEARTQSDSKVAVEVGTAR